MRIWQKVLYDPFYSKSIFSGVSYQFCDSVIYGITLFYDTQDNAKRAAIERTWTDILRKQIMNREVLWFIPIRIML